MVFYKKFGGSWKKIIPIFNKRTENSMKKQIFQSIKILVLFKVKKKFSDKIKQKTFLENLGYAIEKAKEKLLKDKH